MADLKDSLGLAATVLGLAGTVWGYWKFVWSKKKARDQRNAQLAVGDRIAASADLEGEGYDQAIEHYEKALALDPGNAGIFRRIVRATRRRNEIMMPMALVDSPARAEVDAILARLYELRIDDDRELLLEEAQLLDLIGKRDSAVAALRKARALAPDDPDALALLGAFTQDLDLVRRAIAARPDDASYHHGLAYVLSQRGEYGAAVREYRRAAELATGTDISSSRTRNGALADILELFKRHGAKLELPADERVAALEAVIASQVSMDRTQHVMLAELCLELGRLEKAHAAIRRALGDEQESWRYYLPQVRLYRTILERGAFDPAALAAVQAILQKAADAERYDELLETGKAEGHRYKVGLRVEKTAAGDGLLVQRSFAGYPFAKAGVLDGDRILEFAHRRIQRLQDISRWLIEFTPGTDVPLKVQRVGELIDLTLIVQ